MIHDGTHKVFVNNKVRTRDQKPSPLIQDIAAETAEVEESGVPSISLVWGFKSEHRIVNVHDND